MHVFSYALRNVLRTRGRSLLIGIIIMVIAFSVCIGLCIRQSAASAKEKALEELNITAQISPDREAAMEKARSSGSEGFDKAKLKGLIGGGLSLEELQKYAKADSVKSFYYTLSANVDGSGSLQAYGGEEAEDSSQESDMNKGTRGGMMQSSDFVIQGVSSDEAMTGFADGTCKIEKGKAFEEGSEAAECIISDELAEYNSLSVGDRIKVASPDNSKEKYTLKIKGIYSNSSASAEASQMQFGRGQTDPANRIYTSYAALNKLMGKSETINMTTNGVYVLGDYKSYQSFVNEVSELGLSDEYAVSSQDLNAYAQSAAPLENLAGFAGYFLIVVLLIGAIVLIVLNIFSTRERKYEIGVLLAIGMKKRKIGQLFITEILIIALAAVIAGGGIGAAVSVPVTNSLLSSQISSQQESMGGRNQALGREFSDDSSQSDSMAKGDSDGSSIDKGAKDGMRGAAVNYIAEVSSAVDIKLLIELLLISIMLALIGGVVSIVAITRYEPLQILSNRD